MPAGILPSTFQALYSTFFSDANHDAFNGDYAAALAPYDVPLQGNANLLSPEQVKNLVVGARAQRVPTAFLLLHDGLLHVYLQVDKFYPSLGRPASPWDDKLFAQKGELHRNQAVLVEWKNDYFHQLNQQILVPVPATIDATFAGQPELELLGPYAQGEAGTELIKVRRTCFVPPKYVGMFLGEPLTPKAAWERVRGLIVIDGLEEACRPLVKYLQAALTRSGANGEPALALSEAPTAPLADAALLDHRQRILAEDFPELNLEAERRQQDQIAVSIGELVRDNQVAREEARQERQKEKAKGVEEMLGETGLQKLLRWCQVEGSMDLPEVWRDLAKAKKAQQLGVLQWAIDKTKEDLGESELQFIVTPAVLDMVKTLRFIMVTTNHVATGLQPFMFPEEALEGALSSKALYEALYEGTSAPPLSDFAAVMQAKPGAPRAIYQARHQVRRVYILLVVVLGEEHCLVRAYDKFYGRFTSSEAELHRYQQGLMTAREQLLFPTKVLKRNAIDLSYWFEMQSGTPAAQVPPRFEQVFDDIKQEFKQWEPEMSLGFLKELKLESLAAAQPGAPSEVPRGDPSGGPKKPADGLTLEDAAASNPHFLENLFGDYRKLNKVRTRQIRRKIAEKELPALPLSKVDKQPMCLAWHTKGQCNLRCPRAADHVAYTPEEAKSLAQWCAANYPKE
jgi:hypothetical protein